MNDGTALVLFKIFWALAEGCQEYSIGKGIGVGFKLSLGGVLCGIIIGLVTYMLVALCQLCPLESAHTANAQVILSLICSSCRHPLTILASSSHHPVIILSPGLSSSSPLVAQVILSLICAYSAFSVAESYFEVRDAA